MKVHAIDTTGGSSSSCWMIILRNGSHGEVVGVCMGIFATTLVNWECSQALDKYTSPYFRVHHLLSSLLCLKEPILASYPFLGLLYKRAPLTSNALWK